MPGFFSFGRKRKAQEELERERSRPHPNFDMVEGKEDDEQEFMTAEDREAKTDAEEAARLLMAGETFSRGDEGRETGSHAEDEADSVDHDVPTFNSSMQRPERSAEHNEDMRSSTQRRHLLNLPSSIRTRIFVIVLISPKNAEVVVSAKTGDPATKLPLLRTCHQIREEGQPLFQLANNFILEIDNWDAPAILPWWEKVRPFHNYAFYISNLTPNQRFRCGSQGNICIAASYTPNWENLLEWLRLYHQGSMLPFDARDIQHCIGASAREFMVIAAAFEIVGTGVSEKLPWATVQHILGGIQSLLMSDNEGWEHDRSDFGTEEAVEEDRSSTTLDDDHDRWESDSDIASDSEDDGSPGGENDRTATTGDRVDTSSPNDTHPHAPDTSNYLIAQQSSTLNRTPDSPKRLRNSGPNILKIVPSRQVAEKVNRDRGDKYKSSSRSVLQGKQIQAVAAPGGGTGVFYGGLELDPSQVRAREWSVESGATASVNTNASDLSWPTLVPTEEHLAQMDDCIIRRESLKESVVQSELQEKAGEGFSAPQPPTNTDGDGGDPVSFRFGSEIPPDDMISFECDSLQVFDHLPHMHFHRGRRFWPGLSHSKNTISPPHQSGPRPEPQKGSRLRSRLDHDGTAQYSSDEEHVDDVIFCRSGRELFVPRKSTGDIKPETEAAEIEFTPEQIEDDVWEATDPDPSIDDNDELYDRRPVRTPAPTDNDDDAKKASSNQSPSTAADGLPSTNNTFGRRTSSSPTTTLALAQTVSENRSIISRSASVVPQHVVDLTQESAEEASSGEDEKTTSPPRDRKSGICKSRIPPAQEWNVDSSEFHSVPAVKVNATTGGEKTTQDDEEDW